MAEKETLIQKFAKKHFTNTPSHMLRSISVGKFLHSYFMPDTEVPENPATLLNETYTAMSSNEQDFSDESFVRVMLGYINQEPALVTFDMIADLLESDAYKQFGREGNDRNLKDQFENWLVNGSMLSHLDLLSSYEVFYNLNSIKRTAAALRQGGFREHAEYINQIDQQVENKKQEFDETFVNHADADAFEKLSMIVKDHNLNYVDKLKSIYNVLCDEEHSNFFANNLDAITMGADKSQTRIAMIEGAVLTANKILYAYAKRKGLTKEQFKQLYLKFKVDERAEQFEEHAAQLGAMQENAAKHETQSNNGQSASVNSAQVFDTVMPDETSDELADEQPKHGNRPQVKFNPVFDVVKTFGVTLGGATAISAISAIPGVGSLVGPVLGITTVISAGITSGLVNLHKAKAEAKARGEKLKKSDGAKIALKTGIAMMGKATPYALAMALGPKWRAVGAGLVMIKTTFRDLERRANLQREAVEQIEAQTAEQPKGIRARLENFLERCKNVVHNVKKSDVAKSVAYGLGKGAAVYLGGQVGRELGTAIGSNFSFDHRDGLSMHVDTAQMKEDLSETKVGRFIGNAALKGAELANAVTDKVLNSQNNFDLNSANAEHLDNLGKIELTEHARATAYMENHRQYVDGVQHDWYNAKQQNAAIETLEKAGVDDPYGVLRKLGSMSRFEQAGEIENGGFQETLHNLQHGTLSNQDAENIFESLERINEQGGLREGLTQVPNQQPTILAQDTVPGQRVDDGRPFTKITDSEPIAKITDDYVGNTVGNDRFSGKEYANVIPTVKAMDDYTGSRVDTDRLNDESYFGETVTAENDILPDGRSVGDDREFNYQMDEVVAPAEDTAVEEDSKLTTINEDQFTSGMKDEEIVREEPLEAGSSVGNNRFSEMPVDTQELADETMNDATTIADGAAPVLADDGSYASEVYRDLVAKCTYTGTTVDGSYSFTDSDGTYYEINPITNELHIDRFAVNSGSEVSAKVDLSYGNEPDQSSLMAHSIEAGKLSQELQNVSAGSKAAGILTEKIAAHKILGTSDSSFVERQRAMVRLEQLEAEQSLGVDNSVDSIATAVAEPVVEEPTIKEEVVEEPVITEQNEVFDDAPVENNEQPAMSNDTTETEKLSEFKPGLFDFMPKTPTFGNGKFVDFGWDK